jgi:hypothetical protein
VKDHLVLSDATWERMAPLKRRPRLHGLNEGEFAKGCRHKRPYTLHRTALLWSNRSEVLGRTSSTLRKSARPPLGG